MRSSSRLVVASYILMEFGKMCEQDLGVKIFMNQLPYEVTDSDYFY